MPSPESAASDRSRFRVAKAVEGLYDKDAKVAGGNAVTTGTGKYASSGYVTLYGGAIAARPRQYRSVDQVIGAAAQAKSLAKTEAVSLHVTGGGPRIVPASEHTLSLRGVAHSSLGLAHSE